MEENKKYLIKRNSRWDSNFPFVVTVRKVLKTSYYIQANEGSAYYVEKSKFGKGFFADGFFAYTILEEII